MWGVSRGAVAVRSKGFRPTPARPPARALELDGLLLDDPALAGEAVEDGPGQHLDAGADPEGHLAPRLPRAPPGTMRTPLDVARSAQFSAGEPPAAITGALLVADGGCTAAAERDTAAP